MNDVIRVNRESLGSNVNKYGGFWKYTAVFAYMQMSFMDTEARYWTVQVPYTLF
jgi:hypothetical protein